MAAKPIRIFYSTLVDRFYASAYYREERGGIVVITGAKFDVTDQIGRIIEAHGVTFERAPRPLDGENADA